MRGNCYGCIIYHWLGRYRQFPVSAGVRCYFIRTWLLNYYCRLWIFQLCFHFLLCNILYLCYSSPKAYVGRVQPLYINFQICNLSYEVTPLTNLSGAAATMCLTFLSASRNETHPALLQIRLWPDSAHWCRKWEEEGDSFPMLLIQVRLLALSAP